MTAFPGYYYIVHTLLPVNYENNERLSVYCLKVSKSKVRMINVFGRVPTMNSCCVKHFEK